MRGHLTQRSPGSWSLVIDLGRDVNGKRQQRWSTVRGTKKQAQAELTRLLHELNTGSYIEPSKTTLGAYLRDWFEKSAKPTTSAKTAERYGQLIEGTIIPGIGKIMLSKLTALDVQEFYGKLLASGRKDGKGGLSPATVRQIHAILRRALQQAVRWQVLVRNVADSVDVPRVPRAEVRALDAKEISTLLEACKGTPYYLPILLAVTTGLRRGELFALAWSSVDLDARLASVSRSLQVTKQGVEFKEPKTDRSRRLVTLPPLAVYALRQEQEQQTQRLAALGARNTAALVFCQDDGSPMNPDNFSWSFAHWMDRRPTLPQVRFHDLRHSHATLLLTAGEHPKVVSERLGHSTVGITLDTYSHVMPGLQEAAAHRVELSLREVLGPSEPLEIGPLAAVG